MTATHSHYSSNGKHDGPAAHCPAPQCEPWPVALQEGTKPCPCWHHNGAHLHGGHCCMRERVICHPTPERYREPAHCTTCGYPDQGTELCGLCAAPMPETVTSAAVAAGGNNR